jgi:hypothetical protein
VTAPPARRCLVLTDDGIIDPVAVEIAARGIRAVALTRAERQLAAVGILARGGTPYMVAKRLHASGTTALTLAAESAHRARRNEQSPPPGRGAVAVPRGRRDRRRDQPAEPAPGNAGPEVITMATGASVPCPCRCVARTGMHSRRRQAAQAAGGQR